MSQNDTRKPSGGYDKDKSQNRPGGTQKQGGYTPNKPTEQDKSKF